MNPPCKYCGKRIPPVCLKQGMCLVCEVFVRDYKDAHDGAVPSIHDLERFATGLMESVPPETYRAFSYSYRLSNGPFSD